MNAIECKGFGGHEVLFLADRPVPAVGLGEVRIVVHASGVNRPDLMQRKGVYPAPEGASDLLGLEIAGIIESGDGAAMAAAGFRVGDRVCALVSGGGYAEQCVVSVGQCLPVPKGWTMQEAASIPETFFTVWSNLVSIAHMAQGESILIHGGSSGIGVAAIQIVKQVLGASRVIVTAGTQEKCTACLELGADAAINYKEQDFEAEVIRLTEGRGVDVVLDMVAGGYIARNVRCLAMQGRLLIIAVQGGRKAEFDGARVLMKQLNIMGSTLRPRSLAYKSNVAKQLRERVWPLLDDRRIRPMVCRSFSVKNEVGFLCEAASQAHMFLESGASIGKVILDWGFA
jgi:NADPH:quinone reductase